MHTTAMRALGWGWLALAACMVQFVDVPRAQGTKASRGRSAGNWYVLPKIYECGGCKTTKSSFLVHDVQILMDAKGGDYVVAEVEIRKPLPYMRKLEIIITRCRGTVIPNNCEYFTTWGFTTGLCTLVPARGVVWSPFIQSISPPLNCPVKSGPYHVSNGTLDFDILDVLMARSGVYDFIWMTKIRLYDPTPDLNLCFNMTFEIRRMRVRQNKGRTAPDNRRDRGEEA